MTMPKPGGTVATTPPKRAGTMLTESQIQLLLEQFPSLQSVREDTTPIQAGYLMGVHAVINRLRSGI